MRHKLEGGFSIIEFENHKDGTTLFSAYSGHTPLGTATQSRAVAEMQVQLERNSTRYWNMTNSGYFIQNNGGSK